ncbi:hypothetical protein ACR3LR_20205 [Pantoea eucalypti]|uniref:hypothetical protein n=1 Tax=Pantoea eucalypti TaxID=470933 RepID=UPI003EE509DE
MTESITLVSPVQVEAAAQVSAQQQEAPQRVLQGASSECITSEAKALLDAVQAATERSDLPAIQQYQPDASKAGFYLQTHYGTILSRMDDAFRDVQIASAKDVDLLLRGFLVKLVNLSIRSKGNALNQQRIARETAQADTRGAELVKSLTAYMLTRKMQEQFSPDEVQLIREHAQAGRMNIAKSMAGQDVRFLTMDIDWKAKADAMAMVPGSRSVTASIEPKEAGNSVAVQFRDGGWSLSWWNDTPQQSGGETGWVTIQCSDSICAEMMQVRDEQRKIDAVLQRRRPQMVSRVFTDELA